MRRPPLLILHSLVTFAVPENAGDRIKASGVHNCYVLSLNALRSTLSLRRRAGSYSGSWKLFRVVA